MSWCTTGWGTSTDRYQTAATPIANNSYMHAVIYTYTKARDHFAYFQYSKLPTNAK